MKIALTLILLAGVNSTIGNILLKISREKLIPNSSLVNEYISPWFIGALVFYGINVVVFAKSLDFLPVNIGYPILAASSFIMLSLASWVIFGDRMNVIQLLGLGVITLGIFMLSYKPLI
ncbi:MAG: SMR family transporter [Emcibacteraceae bacterium]|jgi:multidrug transporter EmrE-like cation transporter|nr:SMR family transporter [Emcibacteraceae bacterium]